MSKNTSENAPQAYAEYIERGGILHSSLFWIQYRQGMTVDKILENEKPEK